MSPQQCPPLLLSQPATTPTLMPHTVPRHATQLDATHTSPLSGTLAPMAQPLPLPTHTDPARFADAQARLFTGQRLHVGASPIVHELDWIPWLDELVLPGPACRQGFAGTGARGELRPTHHPVTCRRCLRLHDDPDTTQHDQPALFALPDPHHP